MSIISTTPQPVQVTIESEVNRIKFLCKTLNDSIRNHNKLLYDKIYNNKNFTPEQLLTAFEVDAKIVYNLYKDVQNINIKIDPNHVVKDPPKEFLFNEDGSIKNV